MTEKMSGRDEPSTSSAPACTVPTDTNPDYTAKEEDFAKMPAGLASVDGTKPFFSGQHVPYPTSDELPGVEETAPPLPLIPESTPPTFQEPHPALTSHVHATSGEPRCTTVHLPHGPVSPPVFMPVGTKGTQRG